VLGKDEDRAMDSGKVSRRSNKLQQIVNEGRVEDGEVPEKRNGRHEETRTLTSTVQGSSMTAIDSKRVVGRRSRQKRKNGAICY